MKQIVIVAAGDDDEEAHEIESEEDGTLQVSKLADIFHNACGLKYSNGHIYGNTFKRVRRAFGHLEPPGQDGWGDTCYIVIYRQKKLSRNNSDDNSLLVTRLPWTCTDRDLRKCFRSFGKLNFCQVMTDPDTGFAEGFSIIEFENFRSKRKCQSKSRYVLDTKLRFGKVDTRLKELLSTPVLFPQHLTALDTVVEDVFLQHGLSDGNMAYRKRIVQIIDQYLQDIVPDVQLFMYGSSLTGFGLKTSDLNILLHIPDDSNPATKLTEVFEALSEASEDIVSCVESYFTANVPAVLFKSPCGTVTCKITVRKHTAYFSSLYLKLYADMDPRVRKLAVALRHWAKKCEVDDQEKGFLPPYAFGLMTVYYLQQCQPTVLPVLAERALENMTWSQNNEQDMRSVRDMLAKLNKNKEKIGSLDTTVGRLWRGLLLFYDMTFDSEMFVVCVRRAEPLCRSDKRWGGKTLAIEVHWLHNQFVNSADPDETAPAGAVLSGSSLFTDPFSKRNIAGLFHNKNCVGFVNMCLRKSSIYFSLQTKPMNMLNQTKLGARSALSSGKSSDLPRPTTAPSFGKRGINDESKETRNMVTIYSRPSAKMRNKERNNSENVDNEYVDSCDTNLGDHGHVSSQEDSQSEETEYISSTESDESEDDGDNGLNGEDWTDTDEEEPRDTTEYKYNFSPQNFRGQKNPPLACHVCHEEGHSAQRCPIRVVPAVDPLPDMTDSHIELLTSAVQKVYENEGMSEKQHRKKQRTVNELEQFVQRRFEGATLQLFGSSENGFGFRQSDLDICVALSEKDKERYDTVECAEKLCWMLKRRRDLEYVYAVTTAKIPIVKFKFRDSDTEGDFSFDNELALRNTELLMTYTEIDPRVGPLGLAIKWLVKRCDIGDASKGTLSSYAYTLMMLHYLQHTNPPVVPVLQEIVTRRERKRSNRLIEGWDTYFYSNLNNLKHVWPNQGCNVQSEGELWLGFFRYYVEEFNFEESVVTIKQFEPLSKFEKFWNGSAMAIEDPFVLSHNLAGALKRKMSQYIRKTFALARQLYGTPSGDASCRKRPQKFFFDKQTLTDGDPPFVGLCTNCKKIGHNSKDCKSKRPDGKKDGKRWPNRR